ncbi:Cell division protein ZapE [Aquicella lusitana]|uniref:Cell division protein ZapE n=2 Tax=Aquicella lusitana TaxID=254246 RepID=A0A370GVZ0_9COXI|nr:cell division protein ZapE [Aquicella lusitana]VVC73310.1 Cell division protein ZapE [Aquicella lusitana]
MMSSVYRMTPIEYYQEQCKNSLVVNDPEQLKALVHFQSVYNALLQEHKQRFRLMAVLRKPRLVKGLYLWGGVGIGKTFLMDCFYHCIPFPYKMRMHFHQFMQFIHQELKKLQGEKEPLQKIAKTIAQKNLLLCFDELFVSDITDAMILARLFEALFSHGVCLVATSNVEPDELYKNGLQRPLFLPAIALLKLNTTVAHIPTQIDYRLRHLKSAGVFFLSNDRLAQQNMEKSFDLLTQGLTISHEPLDVCGRSIQIYKQAGRVVWFDFERFCAIPRSQQDYLAIAKNFDTIFISNIPVIPPHAKNTIALFIRMVDVFYDARVRLVISAAEVIDKIYSQGSMLFEYTRTRSRLLEMQSESYFLSER